MDNGEQLNWGEGKSSKKYRELNIKKRMLKINSILNNIKPVYINYYVCVCVCVCVGKFLSNFFTNDGENVN